MCLQLRMIYPVEVKVEPEKSYFDYLTFLERLCTKTSFDLWSKTFNINTHSEILHDLCQIFFRKNSEINYGGELR